MNTQTLLVLSMVLTLVTGYARSEMIVDLNANDLPEGPVRIWPNAGTLGGSFYLADADPDPNHSRPTADPNATVERVNGETCVTFNGLQAFEYNTAGYTPPAQLVGAKSFTLAFRVLNPSIDNPEESMGSWSRRGGNCGQTAHFNYGDNAGSGAVVHWCYDSGYPRGVPALGQWHHIVYTYDAMTLNEVIYVDGAMIVSKAIPAPGLDFMADKPLRIGCAQTWVWPDRNRFFSGSMASVQIYDEALSARDVRILGGFAGSVSPEEMTVTEGDPIPGEMTVELYESPDGAPTEDVQVTLAIQNHSPRLWLDGTSAAGESLVLTFPAATYAIPKKVKVSLIDDMIFQPSEVVQITASITGGDPKYVGKKVVPNIASVTLIDNDRTDNPVPAVYRDGFLFDHYDIARDYLRFGVSDTPYDGLLNTQGLILKTDASVTTTGSLHLESKDTNWADNNNSGPFLFKNVSGDFIVETFVSGYAGTVDAWVYNNDCGLLIRNPDNSNGENNLQCSYFPIWGVGNTIRYNTNGVRTDGQDESRTGFDADHYLRVERRGPLFYCSHSADGVAWTASNLSPYRLDNLNVETLQVGFQQATYTDTGVTAWAEFGYLRLKSPTISITGTLDLLEAQESTGDLEVALTPPAGFPAPLDDVKVMLVPVALSGAGADANDIRIGTSAPAQPFTLTFTKANWNQPQTVRIQAVKDNFVEDTQVLTVGYTVSSNDPNWNGSTINNGAVIKVYEPTPGIALIQTGGSTAVTEGGATDTLEISLQSKPTTNVTVDLSDNGTPAQATFVPAQLIFTPDNWVHRQSVVIAAVDDSVMEGDPHTGSFKVTADNGAEYNPTATVIPSTEYLIHDNDCGAWGFVWADMNHDCVVNLPDFALLCEEWMKCTRPNDPVCVDLR